MRRIRDGVPTVVCVMALSLLASAAAAAGEVPQPPARTVCQILSHKTIAGAKLATAMVAADGAVPAYCKVDGSIAPALNFELRLPLHWNEKLYYGGGSGYNGVIPKLIVPPLQYGYAEVVSDSGHQGDGMSHPDDDMSAAFAFNDPYAAQLFGSLAVPMVMPVAVRMLTVAYGKPPSKSYFEGCSTGGGEALMAVQRNPTLFDGVVARSPAYNWVGFMGKFHQTAEAVAAPGGEFSAAKIALLAGHVRAACDGLDGIVDGIVSNPAACTERVVNVRALRCAGGADLGNDCLSDAQLAVISAWTGDVSFGSGHTYGSRGYNLTGNEDDPNNFGLWATGDGDVKNAGQYVMQDTTVKYYLAGDPHADSLAYIPWDQNPSALYALAALNDATQPDIRAFVEGGGKLILWHGGSDSALSVNATTDYVLAMQAAIGPVRASTSTRYYIAPGVDHCGGGVGADSTDLLSALDRWVTRGSAPSTLVAQKLDADGRVNFTRPLCQYPEYPRYTGPVNDAVAAKLARNYACSMP